VVGGGVGGGRRAHAHVCPPRSSGNRLAPIVHIYRVLVLVLVAGGTRQLGWPFLREIVPITRPLLRPPATPGSHPANPSSELPCGARGGLGGVKFRLLASLIAQLV
jgi:hypothetical protein